MLPTLWGQGLAAVHTAQEEDWGRVSAPFCIPRTTERQSPCHTSIPAPRCIWVTICELYDSPTRQPAINRAWRVRSLPFSCHRVRNDHTLTPLRPHLGSPLSRKVRGLPTLIPFATTGAQNLRTSKVVRTAGSARGQRTQRPVWGRKTQQGSLRLRANSGVEKGQLLGCQKQGTRAQFEELERHSKADAG